MTPREVQLKHLRETYVARLGTVPGLKIRAVTSVTRSLILNGPYFFNGDDFDITAKPLGAGVYELSRKVKS